MTTIIRSVFLTVYLLHNLVELKTVRLAIFISLWTIAGSTISIQAATMYNEKSSPDTDTSLLPQIRKYADLARQNFTTNPKKGLQFADSAMLLAQKSKSQRGELLANNARGISYWGQLDYVNALLSYRNSLRIAKALNDTDAVIHAQIQAGTCFTGLNLMGRAVEEYKSALQQAEVIHAEKYIKSCYFNIAYCLNFLERPSEANAYLDKLHLLIRNKPVTGEQSAWRAYKIESLRKMGKYREGLLEVDTLLQLGRSSGTPEIIASAFRSGALLYSEKNQLNTSLSLIDSAIHTIAPMKDHANTGFLANLYKLKGEVLMKQYNKNPSSLLLSAAENAFQLATNKAGNIGEWRILADGFRMLQQIAATRSEHQAALQYYTQYIQYRDTLINIEKEQALHRTELDHALEKRQDSLRIINTMQEKQLTQQQENSRLQLRQTIYGWIISVLVLGVAIGILLFRKRIQHMRLKHLLALKENQAALKESAYQSQMNDLMLSGIKSQMNPHFLFNCLTSITLYIEEQNMEAASRYLSLFSQLIRYTLDASSHVHLLLSRELEMLKLYLELESMRFKQKLTYAIDIDPELDPELIHLPHMMVQPVVENAIWHGLMHKPDGGHIQIAFSRLDDKRVKVTVEDNGIGRVQSAQLKSQKHALRQSMGTQLLQDRISLMNRQSAGSCSFHTEDLSDSQGHPCGTRVTLIISVA